MRRLILAPAVVSAVALLAAPQGDYAEPRDLQTFYLALLAKGPAWTAATTSQTSALQQAHLAHLTTLGNTGHATIAGPFGDDGEIRGIVILKAASLEEAKALEEDDPAVKAGRLKVELLAFALPANWFVFAPISADLPMRQFVFGFLTAGPKPAAEPDLELLRAHTQHQWNARQRGALVLAGPIADGGVRLGLMVYAVDGVAKARADAEADPGVKNGQFAVELHPWFAADGIMKNAK